MLRVQAQIVWRQLMEIPVGCPQERVGRDGRGSDEGIPGAKTRMGGEQARGQVIGFSCGLHERIGAEFLLVAAPNGLVTKAAEKLNPDLAIDGGLVPRHQHPDLLPHHRLSLAVESDPDACVYEDHRLLRRPGLMTFFECGVLWLKRSSSRASLFRSAT